MNPAWLAPRRQPFFVSAGGEEAKLSPELRDTYRAWRLRDLRVYWLTEKQFFALPRAERAALVREQVRLGRGAVPTVRAWSDVLDPDTLRAQADGHRFVWWPSLVNNGVLTRVIENGNARSRHAEVRAWPDIVPNARTLADTFGGRSGPNCFGAVMGAAGVAHAAERWMQREPFERWLRTKCARGGRDDEPGTVLVWRNHAGDAEHAAITLGDGWAFEKPSQEWWTKRVVLSVDDLKLGNRVRGWRLERRRLVA
ncbi:MAG TPA: hypothetical protein VHD87_01275 [Acidimicrobiales bacterium]|nr:hypothetical protein [Acidimicrobiales bacterium]